jgi:hypothetical protein
MSEDEVVTSLAALEYAAARRGLYLTVHALNKVREVLKWELAGDREKALEVTKPTRPEPASRPAADSP